MLLNFEILTALRSVLNVSSLTDNVSGRVRIGDPPLTSQDEDISCHIDMRETEYLTTGFCRVSVFTEMAMEGMHDYTRISEIVALVKPLILDATVDDAKGSFHFQLENDEGPKQDPRRDSMSKFDLVIGFQVLT